MASFSLKDRISSYEDAYNYSIIQKLPIVVKLNGRSFSKLTSLLNKPFDIQFLNVMQDVCIKVAMDAEGCVFAYSFNDEIILILKNDQSIRTMPWYDNNIQKIASVTSSLASIQFFSSAQKYNLNILGAPVFTSQVFAVPNITEAVNVLIAKQQQSIQSCISFACFYETIKEYDDISLARSTLTQKTIDEKIELLQDLNVDYNSLNPEFKKGFACYKVPKVFDNEIKKKWIINNDIPTFSNNHEFITNILSIGNDLVR